MTNQQVRHCDDCGTRLADGLCPNCHEELFIVTTQAADIEGPWSREFAAKIDAQRRALQEKR